MRIQAFGGLPRAIERWSTASPLHKELNSVGSAHLIPRGVVGDRFVERRSWRASTQHCLLVAMVCIGHQLRRRQEAVGFAGE